MKRDLQCMRLRQQRSVECIYNKKRSTHMKRNLNVWKETYNINITHQTWKETCSGSGCAERGPAAAGDWQEKKFSTVSFIIILYGKLSSELTFENLSRGCRRLIEILLCRYSICHSICICEGLLLKKSTWEAKEYIYIYTCIYMYGQGLYI